MTLLGKHDDTMGTGYQILQSKIAVGRGGWFGKGYLQGTQSHLQFLPERHTDFIFAVFAEEWGFAGSSFVLACYLVLLVRSLAISLAARDPFARLVAYALAMMIFWQVVINLLMVLGFLPVVGVPLPLFSFGGSSLLTTLAALGCIFTISFHRQSDPGR
jgi:rod shape determining protein RodA